MALVLTRTTLQKGPLTKRDSLVNVDDNKLDDPRNPQMLKFDEYYKRLKK